MSPTPATADSVLLIDVARAVLDRTGGQRWTVRPTPAWCQVDPPAGTGRRHGWKLHVSATPLSAPIVLARAAEVLVARECSFKFGTDLARVSQLVDIWYDRGGGGKFITAYPRDDDEFRALAAELHRVTHGLAGPRILSDRQYRDDSLVHFRYGQFRGDRVLTDDGVYEARMVGPDGVGVEDVRMAWFSPPPWAGTPFPDLPADADVAPESVLLGGFFRVREAIRHANKGGVYRAVDERDGTEVVIKQARAHVGSALDGTDVRDRLREESTMLDELAPLAVAPARVALFEQQGDLFLAQEFLPGRTLSEWAGEHVRSGAVDATEAADIALGLVAVMRTVHEAGLVIRDLKPHNVMVSPFGEIRLIDVEYVAPAGRARMVAGTRGFLAPELRGSARDGTAPVADESSDCFSLGVTLFCALTALAPAWVSGRPGATRTVEDLTDLLTHIARTHPVLTRFVEPITGLTHTDPAARWSLKQAEAYLLDVADGSARPAALTTVPPRLTPAATDRLLTDGLDQLRQAMTPAGAALWPGRPDTRDHDPVALWTGAAGGLTTLTRAARLTGDGSLRDSVAVAASWVDERLFAVPRLLPGLCYGRAGTAWALYDAARLLDDGPMAARAISLMTRLPVEWPSPDITHGLAGAGVAHLRLWRASDEPDLWERTVGYADAVVAAVDRDGDDWRWPTPAGADSRLAGHSSYGSAHGIAGVGAFLLAVAETDDRFRPAALGAGETLARAATTAGSWPAWIGAEPAPGPGSLGHWCSGSAGIGGFLARLGAATGEQRFLDLAGHAAEASLRELWASPTGACCGLAGIGHLLLDLDDITGGEGYRADAEHVAWVIDAQHVTVDGRRLTGDPELGSDYGYGSAGVLDFLLRLRYGGGHPWMPPSGPGAPDLSRTGPPPAATAIR